MAHSAAFVLGVRAGSSTGCGQQARVLVLCSDGHWEVAGRSHPAPGPAVLALDLLHTFCPPSLLEGMPALQRVGSAAEQSRGKGAQAQSARTGAESSSVMGQLDAAVGAHAELRLSLEVVAQVGKAGIRWLAQG